MKTLLLLCVSGLTLVFGPACSAAEAIAKPPATEPVAQAAPPPAPAPVAPTGKGGTDAQRYCQNIAAAAADARFAFQAKQLADLETRLRATMAALDAKQAEYREILAKREAAMKQAAATLVGIYSKMKPDAAAAQIAVLDDTTAAAVLAQLNARQASAILNEVSPDRAVQIVNAIAGSPAQTPDGKKS